MPNDLVVTVQDRCSCEQPAALNIEIFVDFRPTGSVADTGLCTTCHLIRGDGSTYLDYLNKSLAPQSFASLDDFARFLTIPEDEDVTDAK